MKDHPDEWDKKLVYVTGQRLWIQQVISQHQAFCKCGDPVKHLQKCLSGDGGEATAAADLGGIAQGGGTPGEGSSGGADALVAAFIEDELQGKRY
nr:ORF2 [Anelloviridae sp.]